MSIGVMYAHKLIRYIDRLNRQRQLMQKRILTAVLRTEEKSRSQFSKELHDGLGPLLSSAKMSLTALSREERTPAQREIIDNTTYVIDARCAKFRTTFRRRCSTISDWRAASRTSSRAARRYTACASASRPTCARNGSTPTSR